MGAAAVLLVCFARGGFRITRMDGVLLLAYHLARGLRKPWGGTPAGSGIQPPRRAFEFAANRHAIGEHVEHG